MDKHNPDVKNRPEASVLLCDDGSSHPQPGEVVEIPLLLSAGQLSALEREAYHHGLTAGEMVRRLLQHFIAESTEKAQRIS